MSREIVTAKLLSKSYGKQKVFDKINFFIKSGEIVGLVGRNGCGKTTLMKMILGVCSATSGVIQVKDKLKVGILLDCKVFEYLTAEENLRVISRYSGFSKTVDIEKRCEELLSFVGLANNRKTVKSFSFGMKQRLALALALLEQPDFLVLDEPFVGLDPIGINNFLDYIKKIRDKFGTTILISSHQLNEIEEICDRFLIIKDGRLIQSDEIRTEKILFTFANLSVELLEKMSSYSFYNRETIAISNNSDELNKLMAHIFEYHLVIKKIQSVKMANEFLE